MKSKLFLEWDKEHDDFIITKEEIWQACKAAAIRLVKTDLYTSIWEKQRTWEDEFRDL